MYYSLRDEKRYPNQSLNIFLFHRRDLHHNFRGKERGCHTEVSLQWQAKGSGGKQVWKTSAVLNLDTNNWLKDYEAFSNALHGVAGSSGMTKSLRNLEEIEKNGAGAVVLKSLFEEQIRNDIKRNIADSHDTYAYPEAFDYISNFTKAGVVDEYLTLIGEAKKSISIPVIASINCVSGTDWIEYAKRFEDAGADALELNIFILPSDLTKSADDTEKTYFEIVENVKKQTSIPISVKIGYYFTSLAKTDVT